MRLDITGGWLLAAEALFAQSPPPAGVYTQPILRETCLHTRTVETSGFASLTELDLLVDPSWRSYSYSTAAESRRKSLLLPVQLNAANDFRSLFTRPKTKITTQATFQNLLLQIRRDTDFVTGKKVYTVRLRPRAATHDLYFFNARYFEWLAGATDPPSETSFTLLALTQYFNRSDLGAPIEARKVNLGRSLGADILFETSLPGQTNYFTQLNNGESAEGISCNFVAEPTRMRSLKQAFDQLDLALAGG